MATKITDLAELAVAPASNDVLHIIDVGDTTGGVAGTSKKIQVSNLTGGGSGILTQVVTTVNNAAVLTMKYNNAPIELVAGIAGKIIVPVGITIVSTQAGTTESSSDDLRFGYDAPNSGSGADNFTSIRDMMNGVTGGISQTQSFSPYASGWGLSYNADATGQPLDAWCNDVFNGGWSMVIYTTYYTITI